MRLRRAVEVAVMVPEVEEDVCFYWGVGQGSPFPLAE